MTKRKVNTLRASWSSMSWLPEDKVRILSSFLLKYLWRQNLAFSHGFLVVALLSWKLFPVISQAYCSVWVQPLQRTLFQILMQVMQKQALTRFRTLGYKRPIEIDTRLGHPRPESQKCLLGRVSMASFRITWLTSLQSFSSPFFPCF